MAIFGYGIARPEQNQNWMEWNGITNDNVAIGYIVSMLN